MDKSEKTAVSWYPVRVTKGDCQAFARCLEDSGMPNYFNPAAFRNICFVRSSLERIMELKDQLGSRFSVNILWDGVTFSPARIGDKPMQDFITVAESGEGTPLYLETVSTLLKDCRKVRIISGRLSGVEGRLVRIRKARRVMVDLPGDLAVATEYIRPECMEEIG